MSVDDGDVVAAPGCGAAEVGGEVEDLGGCDDVHAARTRQTAAAIRA
jgi:hypothetical protein